MNKAFLREPDDTGACRCPRCGSLGTGVERPTMAAHVAAEAVAHLAESAFFCPFARCEVVYFDVFERVATNESATHPIWPKDAEAPLCGCFELTRDDIEADLAEGTPRRVRELLAKSKSPEARCSVLSPSGQCCMSDVQRYYMKRSQELGGTG
jgi:hypothetical protein